MLESLFQRLVPLSEKYTVNSSDSVSDGNYTCGEHILAGTSAGLDQLSGQGKDRNQEF